MDVRRATWLKGLSACLLLAFAASPATGQVAECPPDSPPLAFNIPGGDWATAVIALHEQVPELGILYDPHVVPRSAPVNGVVGTFSVCEAVTQLFAHTGLIAQFNTAKKLWVNYRPDRSSSVSSEGPRMRLAASDQPSDEAVLEQVLVTGSLIRGVQNMTAPLQTIDRSELDSAPFGTIQDAMRNLPVNFGGGPMAVFDPQGATTSAGNFNGGESVNLRGLGAGATLVLVDGNRQPSGGLDANFVDITQIPWGAVERIEVLPDGASALYGSDAVAGVVNIILRKDLDGAESQVRFGATPSGDQEMLASQLFGTHWDSGKVLVAYQFSQHTALPNADRAYAANTDKTPFGGTDFRSDDSNPGNILNLNTLQPILAIPHGSNGTSLTPSSLLPNVVNLQNQLADVDLLPDTRMHNVYGTFSQQLGEQVEFFVQGRLSQETIHRNYPADAEVLAVPATNPFNPFPGSPFTLVGYSFVADLGPLVADGTTLSYMTTAGIKLEMADRWLTTFSASYGRERSESDIYNAVGPIALDAALADPNPATAFNPFGDGSHTNAATLQGINDSERFDTVSDVASLNIGADGPLFDLPAGEARVAVGGALRRDGVDRTDEGGGSYLSEQFHRTIASAYTELALPLWGDSSDPHAAPRWELSLAARGDHYSDVGSTVNPKVSLRWIASDQVKLRTGWGTSFRAPDLIDLHDTFNNAAELTTVPDAHSATGQSVVLVEQGNNPSLRNETAHTWTAGLDVAPSFSPDLTVSLTYYGTDYRHQIFQPGSPMTLAQILSEPQWAPLVTRDPTPAQIAAICNGPSFIGSPTQCTASPPQVLIDARWRNLSATHENGLDWRLQKLWETRYGRFNFHLEGSDIFTFRQAVTPAAVAVSELNTVGYPLALRVHGATDWSQRGWDRPGMGVRLSLDYSNGYRDETVVPNQPVGAWTVTNLTARYRTPDGADWSDQLEIALNAANLFNQSPPFVNRWIGFDPTNAQPVGRVVSLQIRKVW
jgi:iron complex outermembrane recepter protein